MGAKFSTLGPFLPTPVIILPELLSRVDAIYFNVLCLSPTVIFSLTIYSVSLTGSYAGALPILTDQKSFCVFLSMSEMEPKGGSAFGNAGENDQEIPPSTIVLPSPRARLTIPSSGFAFPKA